MTETNTFCFQIKHTGIVARGCNYNAVFWRFSKYVLECISCVFYYILHKKKIHIQGQCGSNGYIESHNKWNIRQTRNNVLCIKYCVSIYISLLRFSRLRHIWNETAYCSGYKSRTYYWFTFHTNHWMSQLWPVKIPIWCLFWKFTRHNMILTLPCFVLCHPRKAFCVYHRFNYIDFWWNEG